MALGARRYVAENGIKGRVMSECHFAKTREQYVYFILGKGSSDVGVVCLFATAFALRLH